MYKSLPTIKSFGSLATVSLALFQLGGFPCKVALVNDPKDPAGWQLWKITYNGRVTEMQAVYPPLQVDAPKIHRTLLVPADGKYAVVNRINGNIYRGTDSDQGWMETNYAWVAGNYAVLSTGNLGIMNPARGGWKGSWDALLGRECVAINLLSGKLAWYRSRVAIGTPLFTNHDSIITLAFANPMVLLWSPSSLMSKLHLIAYKVSLKSGKVLEKWPVKLLQGSREKIGLDFFFPLASTADKLPDLSSVRHQVGRNLIVIFDHQKVEIVNFQK